MIRSIGPVTIHGSISNGTWGAHGLGWWSILKAPWNEPLFSERYGYEKCVPLGFGWRFKVRRMRNIDEPPA